jgi:predicted PurR-regulated permease PerM
VDGSWRRSAAAESFRLAIIATAVIMVVVVVVRLSDTIGLVLFAASLAFVSDPVRRRLSRWIGRAPAVVVTALLTFVVIVGTAALLWRDLSGQSERLAELLGQRLDELRAGSFPDRVAEAVGARDGVDAVFGRLPTTVITGRDSARGVGTQVIQLLVAVILSAFFQSSAGSITDWVVGKWARDDRRSVRLVLGDVTARAGRIVRRSLILAVGVSVAVAALAAVCGVPGAVVLGMWAGVWSIVPTVGIVIGLAPVTVTAAASSPVTGAIVVAAAAGVGVVSHFARPRIAELGPVVPASMWVVSIGVGTSIAGLGGAFVLVVGMALAVAWLTTRGELPAPEPGTPTWLARIVDGSVAFVPTWRSLIHVLVGVAGAALLGVALGQLGRAAVWIIIASMVAVALNRPIEYLSRRLRIGRFASIALVLATAGLVLAVVVTLGVEGASSSTSEFSSRLPTVVRQLEDAPLLGGWLREQDAATWVDDQLQQLPQRLSSSGGMADWLPVVGSRVVDFLWVLLLTVALLVDGPRLSAALHRRTPAVHRRQFTRMTDVSLQAVSAYLGGAMLVAGLNASVVLTLALVLGLGLAPVLAAWAFVWNFVPQIGGFMGGFPLVVLALGVGPAQAMLAALVYVSYQFVENNVIQPTVIGESIDVPPWATLLAALAGAAAAGIIGAVVLTPLVGVIRVVLDATRREDFPGRVAKTTAAATPTAVTTTPVETKGGLVSPIDDRRFEVDGLRSP